MKITTLLFGVFTIVLMVATISIKNPMYGLAAGLMGIATALSDKDGVK